MRKLACSVVLAGVLEGVALVAGVSVNGSGQAAAVAQVDQAMVDNNRSLVDRFPSALRRSAAVSDVLPPSVVQTLRDPDRAGYLGIDPASARVPAYGVVDSPSSIEVCQLVAGDRVQPRRRRVVRRCPKTPGVLQRGREHLGCQVIGQLGAARPLRQERQYRREVPIVELTEGGGLDSAAAKQLGVGVHRSHVVHRAVYRATARYL